MKRIILLLVLVVLVSGCASERTITYGKDIRSDYCGISVPAAVCKCAFHGEMCDQAGMTKEEADANLYGGFDEWSELDGAEFKSKCETDNGRYDYSDGKHSCTYCDEGEWEREDRSNCVDEK
jgi:hypothetical protein